MQIVIEIHDIPTNNHEKWILKYGIPLPEHHGDLKDVNKIKEKAIDMSKWRSGTAYGVWVEDIDEAPTIIPATKEGDGE